MIDTKYFKETLEKELTALEDELGTLGRKNPDRKNDWEATENDEDVDTADETERADAIEEFETNSAVLSQLEERLNEVKAALEKIENGKFGICEIGGEEIEQDRLDANPAATTCKKHMEI